MEKKRSIALTLFAVFFIVSGIAICGLTVFLFLVGQSFAVDGTSITYKISCISFFLLVMFVVISNIAVLFLKKWGRKLHLFCVWFLTLTLAINVGFSKEREQAVLIFLVPLIISLCSTIYLTRPKVKEQFK